MGGLRKGGFLTIVTIEGAQMGQKSVPVKEPAEQKGDPSCYLTAIFRRGEDSQRPFGSARLRTVSPNYAAVRGSSRAKPRQLLSRFKEVYGARQRAVSWRRRRS